MEGKRIPKRCGAENGLRSLLIASSTLLSPIAEDCEGVIHPMRQVKAFCSSIPR